MYRHPLLKMLAYLHLLSSPALAFAQDGFETDRPAMTNEVRARSRYVWIEDALWIEPATDAVRLVLRYGQKGQRVEASPGALDRLPSPTAWTVLDDRVEPLALHKGKDGFDVLKATPVQAIQAEDSAVAIRNHGTKFGRKPVLYARWLPNLKPTTAMLTLDILPVDATHFKVVFRDTPLAGARLQLILPDGSRRKLIADDAGMVGVENQQSGLVQLLCSHSEVLAVHVTGEAYRGTRHVSTVTWKTP